jgi:uncharacterized protein (TIGR02391 family)
MWIITPKQNEVHQSWRFHRFEFVEPLEWKCEQEQDPDAAEGVKLDFMIAFGHEDRKLPAGQARHRLAASLAKAHVNWIQPTIHDWIIDLDYVRKICPDLDTVSWLQSQVPVAPEYETSEYMMNEWTVNLAFYIYPESASGASAKLQNLYLLQQMLHLVIAREAWPAFLRGDHDDAVFRAFKAVEVAVRAKGQYGATDIGTDLVRRAFNDTSGPLTNQALPPAERQAVSSLFAGAIGIYKNPHSHRTIAISDQTEVVEKLMLASRLMKIIDTGSP